MNILRLLLLASIAPALPSGADPYRELAADLAAQLPASAARPFRVGVGNFLYGDTELMSPFSALLRQELERVLAADGAFRPITRTELADLQIEDRLQQTTLLEPGTAVAKVSVEGVQGIVRGRFFYQWPKVTVFAELVMLEGGELRKAKLELAATDVAAKLWPEQKAADAALTPANAVHSATNLADVAARIRQVSHEFALALATADARRDYAEGERVTYRVRSAEGCHVAVFCHQVDGSTVLLFPNAHNRDTWVPASEAVEIPGPAKHGFVIEAGPPYGADVVQVVACTARSGLHKLVSDAVASLPAGDAFGAVTRGMVVKGLADSLAQSVADSGPVRWSEAHQVICTYPRLAP